MMPNPAEKSKINQKASTGEFLGIVADSSAKFDEALKNLTHIIRHKTGELKCIPKPLDWDDEEDKEPTETDGETAGTAPDCLP